MAKRISSPKKNSAKKRGIVASPLRRRALTILAVMGLGAGLSGFGLFGKKIFQPFRNSKVHPLYLKGKRMTSKGHPLFLVEGWILSEQDLRPHKKK